jgi:hypothetical protein
VRLASTVDTSLKECILPHCSQCNPDTNSKQGKNKGQQQQLSRQDHVDSHMTAIDAEASTSIGSNANFDTSAKYEHGLSD